MTEEQIAKSQRGQLMREFRERFALKNENVDVLAEKAEIRNSKGIRDHWEKGDGFDFKSFWRYVKVLKRSAAAKNMLELFERELDRLVQVLYPELYEEYVKSRAAGDSRTPEDYAQDRYDSTRGQEIGRPGALGKVPGLIIPLQTSHPKAVLPRSVIESPTSWQTLPAKAFEVNLVFPIERTTIYIHRSGMGVSRTPYLLSIDLRDQNYGIYNEPGKRQLRTTFGGSPGLNEASNTIHQFLMRISDVSEDLSWKTLTKEMLPLRWASAGVLPIVHCLRPGARTGDWDSDGDWVALFFRDIPPVGLNVANGASESRDELRNIQELIAREFAEELVVVNRRPEPGKSVDQVFFHDADGGRALGQTEIFRHFVAQHQELRRQHDDITLMEASTPRLLKPIYTPFGVRVIDTPTEDRVAGSDVPAEQITRCRNIIFSVNPGELGIEVIRPYSFDLREGEWLMDGEILPSSLSEFPYLVRRPIVLLRLDFLREQFRKGGGSLGQIANDVAALGGKCLPEIPPDSYRIFGCTEERRIRLQKVNTLLKDAVGAARDSLENERRLIEGWVSAYGSIFDALGKNRALSASAVRTLCPVTYKTIELGLRHGVFGF